MSRQLLKAIMPPALLALARRARPEWRYVGEEAGAIDERGWQHPSVTAAQIRKWPRWVEVVNSESAGYSFEAPTLANPNIAAHNVALTFGYVLATAARDARSGALRVLDWGGGLGHYYPLAKKLLANIPISYTVADLPEVMAAGRTINPDVTFKPSDEALHSQLYDLVVASGSIQYVPDWRALVRRLVQATRHYLYIARVPTLRAARSFVATQRAHRYGYLTEYSGWCLNRAELLAAVAADGAELIDEFLLEEYGHLARAPEQPVGRGFLFRRSTGT